MKYKNLFASVLILFAFAFMSGCGQSEEQKKLASEIEAKSKEVTEKIKAFKAKESELKCFQEEYDKLTKEIPENEDLKKLAQKHSVLIGDYKKQTKALGEVVADIDVLPAKLQENMRFSEELIKEDYEKAMEKYETAVKTAEKLVEKHQAVCDKMRSYRDEHSANADGK
ncbi:hypothetical protein Ctha_1746 [Chloroherpeton thalassium ATCC 35110]|uniref:Lipoprotein n=1 Tax=Chloroherpeton thalassium (strain ATCC 35110 / GB-78) TaxID=517418 RepID=B3QTA4_CHLT3|nr:hypothetical protein [Chloroherpeton thalassium]ACF14203.1 hypothetical protein Ctha_1746 [Chloroherpeton thalassium ATCC 35110]